jgi:hypothetical protein
MRALRPLATPGVLPGVLAALFPVRIRVAPSVIGSRSFAVEDIRILDGMLCMNEHNLADRYRFLAHDLIHEAHSRWGIRLSRRWLANKQAIHSSTHFSRSINDILGAALQSDADPLLKARAVLCLRQATSGNNGYQNIHFFDETLAVGNNSFCEDVTRFSRLITFGQAGCVVMLVTVGAKQCFMHFSTHIAYQSVMESQLADWFARVQTSTSTEPVFRILSHAPENYRDLARQLAPGGRLLVHRKKKADVYDLYFDHSREAFRGMPSAGSEGARIEFTRENM